MEKNIASGVQSIIDKINNTEVLTPETTTENLINLMKTYSMEQSSMDLNELFLITNDGKFTQVPIKPTDAHGPFGEMLMKKYINEIKDSKIEINRLVELNFGHGIVAKIKKEDFTGDIAERFNKIEEDFKAKGADGIKHDPDYQDYFIVSIMDEKEVNTKIYDIIKASDSNAFVIGNTPVVERDQEYDGEKLINYFKN